MGTRHTLILMSLLTGLAACGSSEEPAPQQTEVKKEKHILSNEQEVLNAAKGINDLMSKNEEEKKKAMEEAMH